MSQRISEDTKAIRVVYLALMAGLLFFLTIAIVITQLAGPIVSGDEEYMNLMLLALLALAAITIPAGLILFKSHLKEADKKSDLTDKIEVYRSALIVRAAMFEGTGFFSVVCVLLFGHYVFIIIGAAILILFGIFFPTKARIARDLKLKPENFEE